MTSQIERFRATLAGMRDWTAWFSNRRSAAWTPRRAADAMAALSLLAPIAGCAPLADVAPSAGYESIPAEEAAWRQVKPQLVGKSRIWVEQCAGKPLRELHPRPEQTTLIYRTHDLQNYCEVALGVIHGRISSVSADHLAPEFGFLRDGSNYCGRMFMGCAR